MYKRLLIFVGLILAVVTITSLLGFSLIDRINESDVAQARAFDILSRAEEIHAHTNKLDRFAYDVLQSGDAQSEKAFWQEYESVLEDIDKLVLPLHNGDCKACHTEFLRLAPQLKDVRNKLLRADSDSLSGSSRSLKDDIAIRSSLDKLKATTDKVHKLARDERKLAEADRKKVARNAKDSSVDEIERRIERNRKFLARIESMSLYINMLDESIANRRPVLTQSALVQLSRLITPEPVEPSLQQDCYNCHYAMAEIPKQAKKIPVAATALFAGGEAGKPDNTKITAFQAAMGKLEQHIKKIQIAARDYETGTMKKAKTARKQLKVFTVVVGIAVLAGSLLLTVLLVRWTSRRLSSFRKGIDAVADGDYAYTIDVSANDEIADLAHAFNLMVSKVRTSQDMLTLLNQELSEMNINTVKAFIQAIEAKDPYTRGHSENVARYVRALGQQTGLGPDELKALYTAALLHDIGKIGIREEVLNKAADLTGDEYEHIKTHPVISAQIVGRIPNLAHIAKAILHHHERYDGSGYPDGLSGENIPLESRMLAIADAFDAMTSTRPYRDGCGKKEALQELEQNAGTQFDPKLVKAFMEALAQADKNHGSDTQSIA